jgi:hypothetical protein
MNSIENIVNYKVLKLLKFYNFYFGTFLIQGHLQNLHFKFGKFKCNFLEPKWFQIKMLSTIECYNF